MITLEMMPPLMFGGLVLAMLIGFPVAFTLAAVGLSFGFLSIHLGFFDLNFLQAIPGRIFGDSLEGWLRLSWVAPIDDVEEAFSLSGLRITRDIETQGSRPAVAGLCVSYGLRGLWSMPIRTPDGSDLARRETQPQFSEVGFDRPSSIAA